jgi:hypothetical protein
VFLLGATSLVFGSFSGWLSGDNRGTLLGGMVAFAAFVAISGLFVASLTADPTNEVRYFAALWAYGISYVFMYDAFRKAS